ncbi:MAG: hypothetical protein IKS78_06500, partial [Clostridia bacterium]|nr:hypothetical protein [Clostridia bacterium]
MKKLISIFMIVVFALTFCVGALADGGAGAPPERPSGSMGNPPDMPSGGMGTPPDMPSGNMGNPPDMPSDGMGNSPDMPSGGMGNPPDRPSGGMGTPPGGGQASFEYAASATISESAGISGESYSSDTSGVSALIV